MTKNPGQKSEEDRVDAVLEGDHEYEPGGETPDYIREWAKSHLGVDLPERDAK